MGGDLGSIAIGGVSLLVVIPLIVEAAKAAGLPERLVPILAIVLGVVGTIIAQLAIENAEVAKWAGLGVAGVLVGLAAIGWNSAKEFYQRLSERKRAETARMERAEAEAGAAQSGQGSQSGQSGQSGQGG